MQKQRKNILIHHIAVALDCSPYSIASLRVAAELAQRLHADLTGIFVEDIRAILGRSGPELVAGADHITGNILTNHRPVLIYLLDRRSAIANTGNPALGLGRVDCDIEGIVNRLIH